MSHENQPDLPSQLIVLLLFVIFFIYMIGSNSGCKLVFFGLIDLGIESITNLFSVSNQDNSPVAAQNSLLNATINPPIINQQPKSLSNSDLQLAILSELNIERAKYGLAPLSLDYGLSPVSQAYAEDMISSKYYGHIDLNGGHAWDRIENAGFKCDSPSYENLARQRFRGITIDSSFAKTIVTSWINSPSGHKYPILDANSKRIGIGVGTGSAYSCYYDSDVKTQICDPDVDETWDQIIVVADFCG